MEFHGVFGHGIPWSSMENLYGISWNYSMEFHGIIPWNFMKIFHGILWNSMVFSDMEFHGIPWRNSMKLHGISPWYLMETFGENSMELFRGIP